MTIAQAPLDYRGFDFGGANRGVCVVSASKALRPVVVVAKGYKETRHELD
jgi:hypothetical protein